MKRFKFGMDKLLELREYREREAEMALAARAGACARLETRLMELARERHGALALRGKGCSVPDFRAAELYSLRIERERERTERELAMAEAERERAREAYVEARKSRTVIDKLRERREKDYYKAEASREQFALDDMANARFGR